MVKNLTMAWMRLFQSLACNHEALIMTWILEIPGFQVWHATWMNKISNSSLLALLTGHWLLISFTVIAARMIQPVPSAAIL